ncbi:tigger transposable element-derived protein 4-like [Dermacentor silvarum]|uniref:tigger transposable element-derived protein 4-like n=1 Tax=Dermacentor silvarum TaxID=543639 RepID=UPI002100C63F|nr:tigger transposable element-derived protein 4-like [Dermacentor silvarum]
MSMAKKAAIVKLVESGRSRAEVAKEFQISKQTLSDYIKNKQKILEAAEKSTGSRQKNVSQGTYPKLEEALLVWLKSTVASKVPVSGGLLKQKAEMMALQMNIEGFKVSDGWLRNFKKRFDLSFKKLCGESAAVDLSVVANYRSEKLQSLLQEYSPDDTFNCDETGLFLKLMPEKTLAFAGDPCHGGKHSKERVTVLIGSNMSGTEKLPMLVISKSKAPRCFKGVKSLPVLYEANKKAWVSGSEQLIDDLRIAGIEIPSNVSFSEFAGVDSELELCAGLTDEEIIRQVLAESESDDDDDLPATAQLTQAELMQAVATLSSAYGDSTTLAEIQADLLTQKRSMVQKRINHFFHHLAQ